ncbi:MAG TPA: papain-like cysteine protease family protein [candidate division Zixibacteria bacterium]|nr:papain-like cysteine protease family protein [candidate division Zixibacteria bacterium]
MSRVHGVLTWRWRLALAALAVMFALGYGAVATNTLNARDRLDVWMSRLGAIIDPPPDRSIPPAVVVTPRPKPTATPTPRPTPTDAPTAEPTPTPIPRLPVDVALVEDHQAVFISQQTDKWCAVAGTQMVLAVLGLGDNSPQFQAEIASRIEEWESWDDSHNGGWGPDAVRQALAAYGAEGYEERAYESYLDALRDSAIAISTYDKPVVMFPWWGAHTWVMTGYRADADPTIFPDARVRGAYILDPWYPRNSSIWGQSDPPGSFEDLAELERNWPVHGGPGQYSHIGPGWTRPEGAYPNRDGRFVVLLPTTPRS